jgi:DNA polymerase-3 subunit delta
MNKKISTSWLLLGPEEGEKNIFINNLIKKWTSGETHPEIKKYYAFEDNLERITADTLNANLFSEKKAVIINGIDSLKRKNEFDQLTGLVNSLPKDALLILTSSQISVNKKVKDNFEKQNIKIFWELFENKKYDWVSSFFRKRNINIGNEAIEGILELVENNTEVLKRECEKIAVYLSEKSEIKLQDIDEFLYHGKEETVFSLFDRIAERNFPACLEILDKLITSGEGNPISITAGLIWQFRNLLSFMELRSLNGNNEEVFSQLKIRGKKSRNTYIKASRKYSRNECTSILLFLGERDSEFRSLPAGLHGHLIKMLLYKIVTGLKKETPKISL